jgi:hypothetical protein
MYVFMYVCMYVCMYLHTYVCIYVRMNVHMYIYITSQYVCVCACVYLCISLCVRELYINAGMLTVLGGQVCPNFGGEGLRRLRIWLLPEAGRGHCVRRQQTLKKKNPCTVTLHSKCTRALSFENLCRVSQPLPRHPRPAGGTAIPPYYYFTYTYTTSFV